MTIFVSGLLSHHDPMVHSLKQGVLNFGIFSRIVPEKGIIYSKSRTAGVGHISRMFSQDVFGVGLHDLLIYSC
jgi:hypothetical protein